MNASNFQKEKNGVKKQGSGEYLKLNSTNREEEKKAKAAKEKQPEFKFYFKDQWKNKKKEERREARIGKGAEYKGLSWNVTMGRKGACKLNKHEITEFPFELSTKTSDETFWNADTKRNRQDFP